MNTIKKKAWVLVGLLLAVAAFTTPMLLTTVIVRVIGPFYTTPQPFDSANINQVGGHVQYYLAGDSVFIGQLVYLSSKNSVSRIGSLANAKDVVGVVVGGSRTTMQASLAKADSMTLAAISGQRVIVLDEGRYWLLDSATALSPGTRVRPSYGSKGRFAQVSALTDSAYQYDIVVGKTVDSTVAGTSVLTQIRIR